jgi:hypothetical protein
MAVGGAEASLAAGVGGATVQNVEVGMVEGEHSRLLYGGLRKYWSHGRQQRGYGDRLE